MTDAAAITPMQTIATLLKTTASDAGALRAICWAVLARWSGFGADMVALIVDVTDHSASRGSCE